MVGKQPIVLLKTVDSNKFLPIWIGHPEAAAILMKLQGATTPRPMTHDLLCDMLGELEVKCTQVSVTELRDNTFFASITLQVAGRDVEIDSRPSDALAIAVRSGAPIFAAEEVIAESAIEFEHEVEDTEEVVDRFKDFLDQVSPRTSPATARSVCARTLAGQRPVDQLRDEVVERDARGVGGLGQQARLGQARDDVGLQHVQAAVGVAEQVDARDVAAARAARAPRPPAPARRAVTSAGRSAGQTKVERPIS